MRRKLLSVAILALAGAWFSTSVLADGPLTRPASRETLAGRLDDLGHKLLGGVFPSQRSQPARPPDAQATLVPSQRMGGFSGVQSRPAVSSQVNAGAWPVRRNPSAAQAPSEPDARPAVRPIASANVAAPAGLQPQSNSEPAGIAMAIGDSETRAESAVPSSAHTPRLYQRMKSLGESAFPDVPSPDWVEKADSAVEARAGSAPVQVGSSAQTPAAETEAPQVARRTLLGRRVVGRGRVGEPVQVQVEDHEIVPTPADEDRPALSPTPAPPLPDAQADAIRRDTAQADAVRPKAAQPDATRSDAAQPEAARSSAVPVSESQEAQGNLAERMSANDQANAERAPAARAAPPKGSTQPDKLDKEEPKLPPATRAAAPSKNAGPVSSKSANSRPSVGTKDSGLLFTRQSPILGVETLGPRRITVGKESVYQLTIRNSGQVAAEQVVVTVDLPEWAEVQGTEAEKGAIVSAPPGGKTGGLLWQVGRLEPAEAEKLLLRIVPRQSKPIDLAVKWDYTPVGSQAVIEVQEPKIELRLDGPREVLFGQAQVYQLEVANSGTGDAENVQISLTPIGTGGNVPATHKLGTLKAGEKKTLDLELTARQTGTLTVQVDVEGDAGVQAHLTEQIAVHRPELKVDVSAPPLRYVGTDVTCQIRVSNPGTAPANDVSLTAAIPPGLKFVSCTGGGQAASDRSRVTWKLESLAAGAETTFELTCNLAQAGTSRVEAATTAAGDLAASASAAIRIEAIADLDLQLTDPAGPVAVGAEATYQVRVGNRGTKSAQEIEIAVYFSDGIEPVSVEGGKSEIAPGQVLFDKIPAIGAGQHVTFQIKAKAETPGNHVCRVEVHCKPLGTRLASEETTYFYSGTGSPQAAMAPAADAR